MTLSLIGSTGFNESIMQTVTIEQALQQAIGYHRAGKLSKAEKLYGAILQKQANHSDANHNLGNQNKSIDALTVF